MASNDSLDGVPGKWPPTEYYEVRRPMEEWVPPLEMLEEMKRDEPHRFSSHDHAHESRCLMLYHSGKSREEVFQEVSRMLSKEEVREDPPQQMNDDFDSGDDSCSNVSLPRVILDSGISSGYNAELKRQFGLLPSLKEERVYQEKSAGGFRVLTGTSQGSRFDVPPKEWIEDELIAVGARRPQGSTRIPDLQGEIHCALKQERWPGMAPHRFDALRQSLLFATNLLHCSAAALSCFFPKAIAHPHRFKGRPSCEDYIADPLDDDKDITPEMNQQMAAAVHDFAELAPSITWVESTELLPSKGWLGVVTSGLYEPEDGDEEDAWGVAKERDEAAGHKTRQLTIAIASEFVDALLASKPDSERNLFATFYAGINIVHELARFWGLHQYDVVTNPFWGEPFVGQQLDMDFRGAYLGWLFGGFIPHPMGLKTNPGSFDQGIQWDRAREMGMTDSNYDIHYSMKISHIERMLSHDEWKTQFQANSPAAIRRELLHPQLPFRINETARIVKWRRSELAECRMLFDPHGLACKGDANFVDYSACPLGFCDLEWDDAPPGAPEHPTGRLALILKRANIPLKMPTTGEKKWSAEMIHGKYEKARYLYQNPFSIWPE